MHKHHWWQGSIESGELQDDVTGVVAPQQARSLKSFERILESTVELIYEEGLEGCTVQKVLVRSGVGASSFYGKFESRDALLEYLASLFWSSAAKDWAMILDERRWRSCGTTAVIAQVMSMLVGWFRIEGPILNAFLIHALSEERGRRLSRISEFDNGLADMLAALLMQKSQEPRKEAPSVAVRVATLQAVATVRSRLLFLGKGGEDGIGDKSLAEEMSKGFLGHVQANGKVGHG